MIAFQGSLQAMSRLGCLGLGAAEIWVPGLGYAISGQWDKTIVIGGARWVTAGLAYEAYSSEYYQEDSDEIYQTVDADESDSGKEEIHIHLNKETWEANYYSSLNLNLLLTTWGDLYQNSCSSNTETYSLMLAPFQFGHFYKKWQFWVPMAVLLYSYAAMAEESDDESDTQVKYYLNRGLTESDLRRDSFPQYYMVGVGEEMFFRGTLQHWFFETMSESWGWSPWASRHLSIMGASAVFAAAHDGSGFTANPGMAFLFGVYEGYVYHPSLESFDLTTAIAIHSWWDILVTYSILNNAEFIESRPEIRVPLATVAFRF